MTFQKCGRGIHEGPCHVMSQPLPARGSSPDSGSDQFDGIPCGVSQVERDSSLRPMVLFLDLNLVRLEFRPPRIQSLVPHSKRDVSRPGRSVRGKDMPLQCRLGIENQKDA